ncbi:hypothetical protein [Myroides odoratus]|uniref:Uncharacterized protein n=1 Tax=Myroides odoratus TaxID=256 RepID=A0A9Q6Z5X0_MYROD|nr:hypothetical protein [Myroides odoratus]EHQ41558.1 hypothetical protein Myrod_0722 [Myroides odoratus DSM 2801]EKB02745.1 hypothetical protein HMPREF9716_03678 [Myroides odoratus CIP 103059]QQT98976.1 hypothetical protein I6I88_12220 [Myroides odoratus]WQD58835.1 hypothetical protein U0010_06755 [Myroides odoratus]STZ28821.1 Uncharacterised protein [Myroides odoratus]
MCEIDWKIVPNWIQAISSLGAIVSIVFLWRTLKAQNKTLVEQQKITNLEIKKFRDNNKPFLKLVDFSGMMSNNFRNVYRTEIKLEVEDNLLIDFKFDTDLHNDYRIISNLIYENTIVNVGTTILIEIEIDHTLFSTRHSIDFELSDIKSRNLVSKNKLGKIVFYFKDKNNENYRQELVINDKFHCLMKPVEYTIKLS